VIRSSDPTHFQSAKRRRTYAGYCSPIIDVPRTVDARLSGNAPRPPLARQPWAAYHTRAPWRGGAPPPVAAPLLCPLAYTPLRPRGPPLLTVGKRWRAQRPAGGGGGAAAAYTPLRPRGPPLLTVGKRWRAQRPAGGGGGAAAAGPHRPRRWGARRASGGRRANRGHAAGVGRGRRRPRRAASARKGRAPAARKEGAWTTSEAAHRWHTDRRVSGGHTTGVTGGAARPLPGLATAKQKRVCERKKKKQRRTGCRTRPVLLGRHAQTVAPALIKGGTKHETLQQT